jgi:D-amino-acid dehydrogenase
MSASPDTVVIGGGIVGTCTALQLLRTGRQVTLIERGVPGDAASGHNGGMFWQDCMPTGTPEVIRSIPRLLTDRDSALVLRWRHLPTLSPWLVRFALASRMKRVKQIARGVFELSTRFDAYRPLVAGTPAEDIVRQVGAVDTYARRETFDPESLAFRMRREMGIPYEVMDMETLARRVPAIAGRVEAAVWFPKVHFTTDPGALTRTLLETFVQEGGTVVASEVLDLKRGNGRVERILTTDGPVLADDVVVAAGLWSRPLARRLGTNVPMQAERGYGIDLPNPGVEIEYPLLFAEEHVGLMRFRSGLRLTGIDELASIRTPADMRLPERLIRAAKRAMPELNTDGGQRWMRMRPSTPDSLPVIGRAPRVANAYFAFGHGHKGLGTGAITANLVQQVMDGQTTTIDMAPYNPARFTLGRRS